MQRGLVFAIGQVSAFGNEITQQAAKFEGFENAIKFTSGEDGAKNIQFLNKTVKDLNLDITSSYSGFQTTVWFFKRNFFRRSSQQEIFLKALV
ncbi:hypothetical protein OEG92_05465 [Polaribacter sejongensis]|uniref:hypothetical protein n=1 Tax=Polaribacter sejongensis TaxID=985043 RepID=UPI0035A68219